MLISLSPEFITHFHRRHTESKFHISERNVKYTERWCATSFDDSEDLRSAIPTFASMRIGCNCRRTISVS